MVGRERVYRSESGRQAPCRFRPEEFNVTTILGPWQGGNAGDPTLDTLYRWVYVRAVTNAVQLSSVASRPRGRGTSLNPANRFESVSLDVWPTALEEAHRDNPCGVQVRTRVYRDVTRTIINRVDSPDLNFKWTVNPYRGCEHGCVYCADGDTSILMANGTTRRLADLRVGDKIYGTIRRGWFRRFVRSQVLAHWETEKPAYRVTLEDGTNLIASADHRFLTLRGWKYVQGTGHGAQQRPHLTYNDKLLGFGNPGSPTPKCPDYKRGYLCGLIRGDGLLAKYVYKRSSGGGGTQHQFRLALTDDEALDRGANYLAEFGVPTTRFTFQKATGRRRQVMAIRTHAKERVRRVRQLVQWPLTPSMEWSSGFMAGIFDAEGSYSGGALRISNTDAAIIEQTIGCFRRFGFSVVVERQEKGRRTPIETVRVTGGLPQHIRFFKTADPAILRKREIEGTALRTRARLGVVAIEPLRGVRQLYDITTETGDFIANGVVSHNCYARPTHETLGFSSGLDFETKIVAKPDAPVLLRRELAASRWRGETIVMSGVTDCYQPLERRLEITRRCLEVFSECRQPVGMITKNRLIVRDLDLLASLAEHRAVNVTLSLTTLDKKLAAVMEPRASRPLDRLRTISDLAAAGIPVSVMLAPIIPGLNDHEIPHLLEAAAEAGATSAGWIMIRLPHQVKTVFLDWLQVQFPDRAAAIEGRIRDLHGGRLYDSRFGDRGRGHGALAGQIAATFRVFAARLGLHRPLPAPSSRAFRRPGDVGQMRLFDAA